MKLVIDERRAHVDLIDSSWLALDGQESLLNETAMIEQPEFESKSAIHPCKYPHQ